MPKVVVDKDVNRAFDQPQHANAKREKEQRELPQAAAGRSPGRSPHKR